MHGIWSDRGAIVVVISWVGTGGVVRIGAARGVFVGLLHRNGLVDGAGAGVRGRGVEFAGDVSHLVSGEMAMLIGGYRSDEKRENSKQNRAKGVGKHFDEKTEHRESVRFKD